MFQPRDSMTAVNPQRPPFFSVVIPVRDGGASFRLCLEALAGSTFRDFEVIVVDDASRDGSGPLAAEHGARVASLQPSRGPAAARNRGAREARGDYLFFLDADCQLLPETLARAAEAVGDWDLPAGGRVDALFGSYDDRPSAPGVVSQFKNLYHHWTHQQAEVEASTFWAGCGVVRRSSFEALGGFDAERYPLPSIEDIEFGYRLAAAGGRIRLVKEVQVRHLKRWTLADLVRTDLLRRGIPWSELLLTRPGIRRTLNVATHQWAVVLLGALAAVALVAALVEPRAALLSAGATALVVTFSSSLYGLLFRRGGLRLALAAVPLHLLYCSSSVVAFAGGSLRAGQSALSVSRKRRPA
jgi:GT2 family glycosyltransferase